ncbi:MAG: 2-succinyl-5-enolpyruvyl-6-hydroxy-3-cyclohexene-1-carboxylic-acid synthase [Salibacteraceae bacterium]
MLTNKVNAGLVAGCFNHAGWENVVVSPGSRNAALIKAFQEYPKIRLHSIVDERSASFFALGLAKALNEPVGLICTSGTAVLNYSSAMAEAYYQGVPLVVMSADRPVGMINTGEGQTIDQQNVFQNFQKGFLNLPEEILDINSVTSDILNLLNNSSEGKPGPIHFNLHFSEPLYDNTGLELNINYVSLGQNSILKKEELIPSDFLSDWKLSNKKIILCGILPHNKVINKYLNALSKVNNVVVLYESTSNLNIDSGVANIDRCLSQIDEVILNESLVLTIGEHIISKKIKNALRSANNLKHWHHSIGGIDQDTFGMLISTLKGSIEGLLEQLTSIDSINERNFTGLWKDAVLTTRELHNSFLSKVEYSDFSVFYEILKTIPSSYHLQSANSSVVRYIQLFDFNQWQTCHANRGTSGIDGSTSTAIGFANGMKEPIVLITGDISFLYDSNGLWNNSVPKDFRIIVINNGGGGIFRIIPGPSTVDNYETLFETNHSIDIQPICEAFGFEFVRTDNLNDLKGALNVFYSPSSSPKLLEVITPREVNADVLKEYFSFLNKAN